MNASHASVVASSPSRTKDSFSYDDSIVRLFLGATMLWGCLAALSGLLIAVLLSLPSLFSELRTDLQSLVTFARLKPLHTQLVLYAFGANAVFAAIYYSTQRLCKCRIWSSPLALLHFAVWQALIVAMLLTLGRGHFLGEKNSNVELATNLGLAAVWIVGFGFNVVMTILVRRERYLYVSLWFYLASIIMVGILQLANKVALPLGLWSKFPALAGAQDAMVQWWYGYNMNMFLMTMPFLGMLYYFLPKASDRPLYSYKWSIVHFWSLVLLLVCAGPQQLHYLPIPDWLSTMGMLVGIMLWMPSWAGVANGLCTLSGAWDRVRRDVALRFMVVGMLIFGLTSLESAILSWKSIRALVHYSDWEIAHLHLSGMGWNGFLLFGIIYWLSPRLNLKRSPNDGWSNLHFWLAVVGLVLTVLPLYISGILESKMWGQLSKLGRIEYSFLETLQAVLSWWWLRIVGGLIYTAGMILMAGRWLIAWATMNRHEHATLESAERFSGAVDDAPTTRSPLVGMPVLDFASKLDQFTMLEWHRKLERQPLRMSFYVTIALVLTSLVCLLPVIFYRGSVPVIASVQPYTPLELAGREIYIAQGCVQCHSQTVRPLVAETQRYGAYSQAGEFAYDVPSLWGTRRIGPDLAREGGGKQSSFWHWRHFENAAGMTPGSVMPRYQHLLASELKFSDIGSRVETAAQLGVPYDLSVAAGESLESKYESIARKQAESIAAEIISQGGPVVYEGNLIKDTTAIALIAYIQRLGTDISRPAPIVPVAAVVPTP